MIFTHSPSGKFTIHPRAVIPRPSRKDFKVCEARASISAAKANKTLHLHSVSTSNTLVTVFDSQILVKNSDEEWNKQCPG